ncbi:MAG: glycine zipper 2TM domain-containing protein [Bdellovibrionales bacterium]
MIRYPFIPAALFVVALGGVGAVPTRALAGGEGEFFGTVMGAGLGGLLGSQFGHGSGRLAATGTGVFLGGWMGNSIGRSSDRQAYYSYAPPRRAHYAPSYSTVYEETYEPSSYIMTYYRPNYVAPPAPPPAIYVDDTSGSYCREYSQQIRIGNQVQESYGTACMQPDGSWKITQ